MPTSPNLFVSTDSENEATIVVKFQEAISLALVFDTDAPYYLPENFFKAASVAWHLYGPFSEYVPVTDDLSKFWNLLSAYGAKLTFLYADTPPIMLLELVQRAQQRAAALDPGYGKTHNISPLLRSANLFTYFQLQCPAEKAEALDNELQNFTPGYKSKYPLLELAYQRGTFVPASVPTTPAQLPTDYMALLNLTGTLPVANQAPIGIHIVDFAWLDHTAFRGRVNFAQQPQFPSVVAPPSGPHQHGCWVLGVLISQDAPFRGTAPQAAVKLFSAYAGGANSRTRIDDALAQALYASTPSDVILLELALGNLSRHDGRFSNLPGDYPVETDQACYDLIWFATHELGLTVVEPAGNGSTDLDLLDAFLLSKGRVDERVQADFDKPTLSPGTSSLSFTERSVIHRARYLSNKPQTSARASADTDSGAILVGAAVQPNHTGVWQNGRNYGSRVDCLAPGEQLLTTDDGNGQTQAFGETSGATALVAGFIVQLKQLARQKNQLITPVQVRAAIRRQCGVPITQNGAAVFPDFKALSRVLLP
ncbi:S8 family serine peptidase [uncultured Fibrella sp.]|uniref:S8 family serine peptidase n=1 Tax=uncultured Fibrella sp. TaxID=1284596 RepID=UPI0035CAF5FC